jgi:NAD(P)-dependent dehydrogenase (short-subunit alcohol dehydrogenase family)
MSETGWAFITGAATGIGEATARLFASRGWSVGTMDIDEAGLDRLAGSLGAERCVVTTGSVVDQAAVDRALAAFSERSGGRLDLLVNNAGVLATGPFESIDPQLHDLTIDVNIRGVVKVSQAALPLLKATPGARIVNISSASAIYGVPDFASYSASKFFVRGFSEALNIEWARYGIHVCHIMPPFVATNMIAGRHTTSMDRLGVKLKAEDVAEVIWRAAHGRRVAWPITVELRLLKALTGVVPDGFKRRVMRKISGY